MLKKITMTLAFVSGSVFAQDIAHVVRVEPRYVTIQQRQCQQIEVQVQDNNAAGIIIGGVAGGIIGNQVGKGSGRDAATALGAVTGAIVGNNLSNRGTQTQIREECRIVPVQVQQGRIVTFNYQGNLFTHTFSN